MRTFETRVEPTYPVGSVGSALRLLLLVIERQQLRISDASKELDVSPSTVHRLMQMLQAYGFVAQDTSTKHYEAGPELINLGLQVVQSMSIRTVALPHISRLSQLLSETVHLVTFEAMGAVLCLDSVETQSYLLRVGTRTGTTMPATASAGGRAILSTWPESDVRRLYPKNRLPDLGTHTLDSRAELLKELEQTRRRGYALQRDEVEEGISAIAAPVAQDGSKAEFAVDVAMPSIRMSAADVDAIAHAAIACAANIAIDMRAGRAPSEGRENAIALS